MAIAECDAWAIKVRRSVKLTAPLTGFLKEVTIIHPSSTAS